MMIDSTGFLLIRCQSRRILVVAYVVLLWSSQQLKLLFGVKIIICTRSLPREPRAHMRATYRATFGRWDQMNFAVEFQNVVGADDQIGLRIAGFYEESESLRDTV